MGRYIIRRLLQAIPLLFFISLLMFILVHTIGSPVAAFENPEMDEAGKAALRASYGLNDPLPVQYVKWVTGNFGTSFVTSQPVTEILAQRFPATLELFITAFALALGLSLILGTASAARQGRNTDYAITTITIGIARH